MWLGAVVGEDSATPTVPGVPAVEGIEVRALGVEHALALK
jgi:hypothetical protein